MRLVVLCIGVLLSSLSWEGLTAQTDSELARSIRAFVTAPELAHAAVSISVVDLTSGRTVGEWNSELNCIPASTLKLITTAAALHYLGPDYRFRTQLLAEGTFSSGAGAGGGTENQARVLDGNLRIRGGGDPTLGSPYMEGVASMETVLNEWTAAVRRAGITRVTGYVVGDGSYYGTDGTGYGWPYNDLGNYYGAGAYGLNFHENSYFLDLAQRGTIGETPPILTTRPKMPGLRFVNELRSGPRGSGDQAYIYGAPGLSDLIVRGTIPIGRGRFTIRGSVPDPAEFTARLLVAALSTAGIETLPPASSARLVPATPGRPVTLLDERLSPPLVEIVDRTNLRSLNLYAEALLREINKSRGLPDYELANSELVLEYLRGLGLATDNIRMQDGSGLGTRNFFSAGFMTAFLATQADNDRWRQSIPLAGRTGSLRRALRGTAAEGRLYAKSGSLEAVRAYAGYLDRPDGRRLAFTILVNNYSGDGSRLGQRMRSLMAGWATAGY